MTTQGHEAVDLAALTRWMDDQQIERGPIDDVTSLQGGTQNVLLRFRRGKREFVLRRPPRHPRPNSNDTMRREARVLAALADTGVPHPELIAACPSEDVLGAAFYLMERWMASTRPSGCRRCMRRTPPFAGEWDCR